MNLEKWYQYKNKTIEWWLSLALREQRLVAVGGVAVLLFILYAGIWSPILSHLDVMRKKIHLEQRDLAWMQAADKKVNHYRGEKSNQVKSLTNLELISILQKQVKQAGLNASLTGLKQANNESIEMHFQKVEFDKLITLLTSLVKEHHINITQMSATADSTPGLVSADIVLVGK